MHRFLIWIENYEVVMARERKNYKTRNTFYIITNGKATEKNYFDLIKKYKSIYDVKVVFNNGDVYSLIKFATKYTCDANQVWCVFDIDNSFEEGRLEQAVKLAKKNNIELAYSNIAFETWLLFHFENYTRKMDANQCIEELDKILVDLHASKYEKNNKELLKKFFVPEIKTAVNNAKINYQNHVLKNRNLAQDEFWKCNPCSRVFKLIEALKFKEI